MIHRPGSSSLNAMNINFRLPPGFVNLQLQKAHIG